MISHKQEIIAGDLIKDRTNVTIKYDTTIKKIHYSNTEKTDVDYIEDFNNKRYYGINLYYVRVLFKHQHYFRGMMIVATNFTIMVEFSVFYTANWKGLQQPQMLEMDTRIQN